MLKGPTRGMWLLLILGFESGLIYFATEKSSFLFYVHARMHEAHIPISDMRMDGLSEW